MSNLLGTADEWKQLGFKCGVEIHHQIDTKRKLFCRCPSGRYYDTWHAEVLRHMRPTMSELGEYDGTALMEFKTRKEIIYRLHRDVVCTYEMDDNPPFPIDDEAVDIALTVAHAFDCKIVGELHVIRKQYLDGSIPAGFQRTCIIGVDGVLPMSNGKEVRVIQIGLEEDACREIADIGHRIVFAVDRLGMPLIEVVTEKQFETPEEVAEGVERISRLLRATGLVRRGIGAGRQDVNVSIDGSTRVEIKGVPRFPRIPELTAHEARRQESLLKIAAELQKRGFQPGDRPGEDKAWEGDSSSLKHPVLQAALAAGDTVRVIKLPSAAGLVSFPLTGDRRMAHELAGRVRVIACLDQVPNLLHSDGEGGGLKPEERKAVSSFMNCGVDDVALVVWGPDVDTVTAANEILDRWAMAIAGVPNETRQALRDNTTDFERVLPGADRMYPDTDSPPKAIEVDRIELARKRVPEAPWDREARYLDMGIADDMARSLSISRMADLFEQAVRELKVEAMRAGEVLTRLRTWLRREDVEVGKLCEAHWEQLLQAVADGRAKREIWFDLVSAWCETPEAPFDSLLETHGWTEATEPEIEKIVAEAVAFARKERPEREELHDILAMGHAMEKLAGREYGREVHNRVTAALA